MRRLVPWLVTGILAVGAGAGGVVGGLGLPGRSPAAWASRLLATTRAAGTAQVEVTTVTTSPSPLLVNALTQSGPVDFRTGSFALGFSVGPRTSHLAVEQIVIGRHQYLVTKGGLHHTFATTLPQRSVGPLGSVSAVGSLGALERPDRVWQVRRLGTARIGAIATTRFQVEGTSCGTATSVTVWVDGQDRLVQVLIRSRAPVNLRRSAAAHLGSFPKSWLSTHERTTHVVRFSHFGRPARIAVPGSAGRPTVPPAARPLLPSPVRTPTGVGVAVMVGTAFGCVPVTHR